MSLVRKQSVFTINNTDAEQELVRPDLHCEASKAMSSESVKKITTPVHAENSDINVAI